MVRIYETGHVKNVANFYVILSACTALGSRYNPSNPALSIASLQQLHRQAEFALRDVRDVTQDLNNAVNQRKAVFANVKSIATRIIAAMKSCQLPAETIKDADGIKKKIQGVRAKPLPKKSATTTNAPAPDAIDTTAPDNTTATTNTISTPDTPEVKQVKTISASQQSYDNLAEHMAKLASLLSRQANYNITDADINLSDIQNKSDSLLLNNKAVVDAVIAIDTARDTRNTTLYHSEIGLYAIAQSVKNYIKSAFGTQSTQYKSLSPVKITLPK